MMDDEAFVSKSPMQPTPIQQTLMQPTPIQWTLIQGDQQRVLQQQRAMNESLSRSPPINGVQRPKSATAGTIPQGCINVNINTRTHGVPITVANGDNWYSPGDKPIFIEDVPRHQGWMKEKLVKDTVLVAKNPL